MENFRFLSPTEIVFGRGTESLTGELVKRYASKILFHYGGGSIKRTGLYDRVMSSLRQHGVEVVELGNVQPNPRLSLVQEGIELCRREGINFILAVGGGSVIDSAKAIGVGVPYPGDVWDFYAGKAEPKETLPVGVVLTIAAAGSEASKSSVITNEAGWLKRGINYDLIRPVFAVMNPELTFTLPPYQTACGVADIMAHIMERYFSPTGDHELLDRLCEATLKAVISNAYRVMADPHDYNARAQIMRAGTLAHNDLLSTGRIGDWASHQMEHEISAIYDLAHGAGLAIVFPAWMKYVYKSNVGRFVQFAHRVWDVDVNFENPEAAALAGINRLEQFFTDIGLPTRLSHADIGADRLEEMADKCRMTNGDSVGQLVKLTRRDVLEIYKLAV